MKAHLIEFERATEIAQRDQIRPVQGTRHDTGELIWLVQSRSDPSRSYLLTMSGGNVHCVCPQARYRGICAHVAAVCLAIQARQRQDTTAANPQPTQPALLPAPQRQYDAVSRGERERRQRVDAERRECALLWTDDRPFSIWK